MIACFNNNQYCISLCILWELSVNVILYAPLQNCIFKYPVALNFLSLCVRWRVTNFFFPIIFTDALQNRSDPSSSRSTLYKCENDLWQTVVVTCIFKKFTWVFDSPHPQMLYIHVKWYKMNDPYTFLSEKKKEKLRIDIKTHLSKLCIIGSKHLTTND